MLPRDSATQRVAGGVASESDYIELSGPCISPRFGCKGKEDIVSCTVENSSKSIKTFFSWQLTKSNHRDFELGPRWFFW